MSTRTSSSGRSALSVTLWFAQVMLFLVFGLTGFVKAALPIDALVPMMGWVAYAPPALVRFIGIAELAGAVGVIIPALTRVYPSLTPLAALCLAVVMLLATAVNVVRGDVAHALLTLALGGLAVFVAWGRHTRAKIPPMTTRDMTLRHGTALNGKP